MQHTKPKYGNFYANHCEETWAVVEVPSDVVEILNGLISHKRTVETIELGVVIARFEAPLSSDAHIVLEVINGTDGWAAAFVLATLMNPGSGAAYDHIPPIEIEHIDQIFHFNRLNHSKYSFEVRISEGTVEKASQPRVDIPPTYKAIIAVFILFFVFVLYCNAQVHLDSDRRWSIYEAATKKKKLTYKGQTVEVIRPKVRHGLLYKVWGSYEIRTPDGSLMTVHDKDPLLSP